MPTFKDITVVGIHGKNGVESMISAVERTAESLPGVKKLLITNVKIDSDIPQKLVYQEMDYVGYSHFLVYCLHQYIETEYVLIVQDDGWALNGENWDDKWFEYDYIGALTHSALVGDRFLMKYTWVPYKDNAVVVQNGGFSFRSRALLEAPSKYGIVMKVQEHAVLNNEDVQLCCFMRSALEGVGMKFATNEDSIMFSFEHLERSIVHNGIDLRKVFGMHSKVRKLVSKNVIKLGITREQCSMMPGENEIIELLREYDYELIWKE